ncbi:dienelactone hydrolase family protein [Filomicrobium sp.]|uniref:dienelactone hydrolase family protein n=1 Tax=Filomicrobium sp. TaxID=2024831 RepID=UPI002589F1C1|nr:dienelactone hydrolase family protein [Filomicrobium sp.]MCV0370458.1 dienelactone hydrolase family protein [Filomicrobium sp.]
MRVIAAGLLLTGMMLPMAPSAYAGETISYEVDGSAYEGYFAKAQSSQSKGLVVIIHDWDGLTDYEIKRADMISDLGYDAVAIDLFGKGNRPVELEAKKTETGKLYKDRAAMRSRILGGLKEAHRLSSGNVMVIGYCFGGAAVLELARSGEGEDIRGYVSFHGGLATPEGQSYPTDTAPILIAHGGGDTAVSMQEVAALSGELEKAKVTYDIEVYSGAPHAFTVIGSDRYQERADRKSWAAFEDFLETNLGD